MTRTFVLRTATAADIPILVRHRRWMFEDIARLRGQTVATGQFDAMDQAYNRYLVQHLGSSLIAWVIEVSGQVAASGSVVVFEELPSYRDPSGRVAYLHSMYTAPAERHKGYARRIVNRAIQVCKQQGFHSLRLHASQEGRPLYATLGFNDTNEMRLDW
jgi:GNAT superfamily N-acetyltransferase